MPNNVEEVKNTVDGLQKAWSQFKETNEKRIADLENGKGTAEYDAQLEKINGQIDQFMDKQKTLDQERESVNARADELERKVNLLQGTSLNGGGSAQDLKKHAQLFEAVKKGRPLNELGEVNMEHYQAYANSFRTYLRYGMDCPEMRNAEVINSMSVGSDPDGGYLVPTEMDGNIIKRIHETSDIRAIATVTQISSGDALEIPNDVNQAASGGWVGETTAPSDTDTPKVGKQRIVTHEQYAQPKATQKLLDDAVVDIEAWLEEKIVEILTETENAAFVSGTGVEQPRGFLDYGAAAVTTKDADRNWGELQYIASGAAAGFPLVSGATIASDANALVSTVHALKRAYRNNARWVMSRLTAGEIRKLRDENGRYLWEMSMQVGQPNTLLGYPVAEAEDMPELGSNSLSVAFGDFARGYRIVDRRGVRILRDPFTDKPWVKFYTTKRVGGDVVDFDAIKLVKFAAS
jgi:HK97 family phage major capsid protein